MMEKVFQKSFHVENVSRGDCLRACIESITGIKNLEHYTQIDKYVEPLWDNDLELTCTKKTDFPDSAYDYCIGCGPAARGVHHACVYDLKGNLVHDPYPNGNGLIQLDYYYYFEKVVIIKIDE